MYFPDPKHVSLYETNRCIKLLECNHLLVKYVKNVDILTTVSRIQTYFTSNK